MISVRELSAQWAGFALKDINLDIASGEYLTLVGPTGAGKTLLLETLAGIHRVRSGSIIVDGQDITFLRPEDRNVGMVYQDYALFPHLSVSENIAFPLRRRGMPRTEVRERVTELAGLTGIGGMLERKTQKLSGGEKQRVAIARALAAGPVLLLLDEPVSALDPETREGLLGELRRIHRASGISVIHVTHDLWEAQAMGSRIAVMGEGSIRQVGGAADVIRRPDSEFVARFTRVGNIIPAVFVRNTGGLCYYRTGNLEIASRTCNPEARYICIRPEDILLVRDPSPGDFTHIRGTIRAIREEGTNVRVTVDCQTAFACLVGHMAFLQSDLHEGEAVSVVLKPEFVHAF